MKIQNKTTALFLLLSLIPLIVTGWITYVNGQKVIARSLGENFHYMAHGVIDKVDRSLYEVYNNALVWSDMDIMQEVISGDIDGKISSFLAGLGGGKERLSCTIVLNTDGEIVASGNPQWVGRNLRDSEAFQQGIRGGLFSQDLHVCPLDNEMVAAFSSPIRAKFDKDKIVGVFMIMWDGSNLAHAISSDKEAHRLQRGEDIVMVRRDGLMIATTGIAQKDVYKRNLATEGFQAALLTAQGKEGFRTECLGGGKCLLVGYDYSQGYGDFRGFGWGALVFQDIEKAFAPLQEFKFFVLSLGAIVACIVVLLSFIASRDIINPLARFSQVASRVAQGDFNVKVEVSSRDEIGQLAESFNQMAQNLQQTTVSRDYMDSILSHMINSLIILTPQGHIQMVNEATCQMLGYTKEELEGRYFANLFIKGEASEGGLRPIFEEETIREAERAYKTKDGREVPVLFSSSSMRTPQGKISGVICVAQDITARKRAEAGHARLAAALQAVGDAIMITDTDAAIQYVNPAFERMTGYRLEEAIGRKPSILKSGRQDAEFYRQMWDTLRRGRIWSGALVNRRKDGTLYDVEATISIVRDDSFKIVNYASVQRDVTQRKRMENDLKAANEDLAKEQKAVRSIFADLQRAHRDLSEREKTLRGMFTDLQKADEEIKKTQRQLLQSEKLASIGQLAAGVAHEINNPLGFISSNLQSLEDYLGRCAGILNVFERLKRAVESQDPQEAQMALREIAETQQEMTLAFILQDVEALLKESKEGIERIKKIVLDLRTFAREDESVVEMMSVEQIIDSILNIVGSELKYKAELVKEYGGVPAIKCNSRKIGQVFINLLVNAAQAIEGRGTIRIKTYQKEKNVCVQVWDSGKGIDEEAIKKIFDPFFTTKPVGEGTGLGLSISYDIIKEHGGDIIVESRPGKGTSFTVVLPIVSETV